MLIGLLGPVEVRDAAGLPVPVGGRRLRTVLARLAVEPGRLVSVEALVDAVWSDEPPAGALNALQSLLSRLRRALGDGPVQSVPAGYCLALPADAIDTHRFARLARDGRAALTAGDPSTAAGLLRDALLLWRGDALADCSPSPFRDAEAARWDSARLAATEDRIQADLALGRHADVVVELEALSSTHPLRERPHAQLVTALHGAGRQADALAAFDGIRRRLADELGVDPGEALASAHAQVLGAPTTRAASKSPTPARNGRANGSAPGARTNLRAALTTFVGKEQELAVVDGLLERHRLVTLVGPGGAGKTRLAEEAARSATGTRDNGTGGVWFVPLAPVGDGRDLAPAIMTALGRREFALLDSSPRGRDLAAAGQDGIARLTDVLRTGRTVLVLDNCEHLIDAVARLVHGFLLDCPGLRVVATSREPLGVPGERLHQVQPLTLPAPDAAQPADVRGSTAVTLLVDRASAVRPGFRLDSGNVPAVVEICRRLDGMPLALELAAARLRTLSPEQLAARLGDRFRILTGGSRTALPRHQTLHAVVAWSWDLLDGPERALWRRLAIFPAGATLTALEEACADPELPPDDVLGVLASLVDKSLVEIAATGNEPRYRMLETVRAFGVERLAEAGESTVVRDAHLAYYLALAETAEPLLRTREQVRWMERLTADNENLLAAVRWAVERENADGAIRMVAALAWYWSLLGAHSEADHWCRAALGVPGPSPASKRALVLAFASLAAMGASGYEAGSAYANEASRLVAELSDDELDHPMLLLMDGILAMFADDMPRLDATLEAARQHRDPWVRALAIHLRGSVAENVGRAEEAEADFLAARQAFTELGDRWGRSMTLSSLATVRALRGDHAGAIAALTEASELVLELGADDDIPRLLLWLATQKARSGDIEGAKVDLGRARDVTSALGADHAAQGYYVAIEGMVLRLCGDTAAAAPRLAQALAGYDQRAYGPPQIRSMLLAEDARLQLALGDPDRAAERVIAAIETGVSSRDAPIVAGAVDASAAVVLAGGDPDGAALLLGVAVMVRGMEDLGNPDVQATVTAARAALGTDAFDREHDRGRRLPREEVPATVRSLLAKP